MKCGKRTFSLPTNEDQQVAAGYTQTGWLISLPYLLALSISSSKSYPTYAGSSQSVGHPTFSLCVAWPGKFAAQHARLVSLTYFCTGAFQLPPGVVNQQSPLQRTRAVVFESCTRNLPVVSTIVDASPFELQLERSEPSSLS